MLVILNTKSQNCSGAELSVDSCRSCRYARGAAVPEPTRRARVRVRARELFERRPKPGSSGMARNRRGGVRYGLLFAVLFAFVSYTTGVSTHGSVAAELAAAPATEEPATEEPATEELAAEPATKLRSLGNVQMEELNCDDLKRVVGKSKSYPKSTQNVTYCLTIGNGKCWRGKNAAKSMRYHYKGQTNDGRPLCPIAATWPGKDTLVRSAAALKNTGFDPSVEQSFYAGKPSFDKVIVNNHGVWRCKHASDICWCRDEAREGGVGDLIRHHTCSAVDEME